MTQMALLTDKNSIGVENLPVEIMNENNNAGGIPATYEELKEMKKILSMKP